MAALNYAKEYARELAQAYPYTLYFGAIWSAIKPDVKFVNAKTVEIPSLSTTGRTNGDRDSIGTFGRHYDNAWETKTLSRHRTWDTLVHPRDIDETNHVASIANITKVFNEEQKFPEMDAEAISTLYTLKNAQSAITAKANGYLTINNVLSEFDILMDAMDEKRVPQTGRLLYCDTFTKTLIDTAKESARFLSATDEEVKRRLSRIDEVEIISVPTNLMKTAYTFYTGSESSGQNNGYSVASGAKNVKMLLIHLSAVIPVVSYEFAELEAPSAMSKGKYVYFEESFEDLFIYNKKHDAIQFLVENPSA